MAKLDGVKVVNETVEYNGSVYTEVEGKTQENDLIKFVESELDITPGAFYLVDEIDSDGDVNFIDDNDDYRYFPNESDLYKTYRKSHAITTDKLTDAEGVVKIELPDGTKLEGTPSDLEKITRSMQKMQNEQQGQAEQVATVDIPEEVVEVENVGDPVSKRLQVGDYAKVITHDDNGQSKFGDIVKVTEDDESNVPFDTKHLDGSYAGWHYENDLVRATEAEVKEATATKDEPLKIGDYAKIIQEGHGNFGKVVKITNDNRDGQLYPYSTELLDGTFGDIHSENHLVKATEAEVLEAKQALLKEGDFAKVVANTTSHYFEIGTVVKLDDYAEETDAFTAYYIDGSDFWRIYRSDLEPLTKEEVLEAKRALLKEGAFARIIGGENTEDVCGPHNYETGTIVKLACDCDSDGTFETRHLNGDEPDAPWVHRKDLEPLTKEEAEHIAREAEEEKKAKAEHAKWSAIGREVGELRDGDVVQFTESTGTSEFPEDSVAIITNVSGDEFNFGEDDVYDGDSAWVKLIVPVEQRFDTVG
ncbi:MULTISPECIES: hypothetical protein [Bacillus cereus group]|uniref:hypothetical protein n=1 Tax=Bacillus cereus group TaxID=86661 RepID=UPI0018CE8AD8|nr:hypothetical protein [Bacillus thuringiensis]MBG9520253.1 hypothetical protein [Bacillus thuringiensis]